jgi:chromosome partitioning protein
VLGRGNGAHRTTLRDVIQSIRTNLALAPADVLLSAIPEMLAGRAGRENVLSDAIAGVAGDYDYVVVDCPPTVGLLTFNALKACSEAIVPMDPSFFSLHGIGKLLETLDVLGRETGHHIAPRVLVTLYSGRSPFVQAVLDEVRHHLDGRHFQTVIRYSVKLAEAASHGMPIADYCRRSAGFDDYEALAAEILQQEAALVEPAPAAPASGRNAGASDRVCPAAPTATPDGVRFSVEAADADQVQLAGDFNDWTLDGSDMDPVGTVWTKVVKLEPGRYRYRYVIDGHWQNDPLNAVVEPSPYGGHDSILVVDAAGSPAHVS